MDGRCKMHRGGRGGVATWKMSAVEEVEVRHGSYRGLSGGQEGPVGGTQVPRKKKMKNKEKVSELERRLAAKPLEGMEPRPCLWRRRTSSVPIGARQAAAGFQHG